MKETVEREIKLAAGAGFTMPELGGETMPTRVFVSTYHDTPDLRLARHGVTFRHRIENGAGVWQLKLPHGEARLELEQAGPPALPPPELLSLLPALILREQLVPVARLRTRREIVRAAGAEVVDDAVAVLDRQRVTRRFREIEVELVDGDDRTLRRLEKALRRAGADGDAGFRPKLYHALDLTYPVEESVVADDSAPSHALTLRLREQERALLSFDPGTRLGRDAEDLHQMRVATRRLRAYLRGARRLIVDERAEPLRSELGWLGGLLGAVRDLDVQIEYVGGELARAVPAGGVDDLLAALQARREEARVGLLDGLASERYFGLLEQLAAFCDAPSVTDAMSLSDVWWRQVKRLRRAVSDLGAEPADGALHAVRIDVKRARYAAELAAHELGKRGRRFVDRAKTAQDLLGAHQDSVVAEGLISSWADGNAQPGAQALVEREHARRRQVRRDWPEAWGRLEAAARSARR